MNLNDLQNQVQGQSVKYCECEKNEITNYFWEADHDFSWDQKKVVNRDSWLTSRKINEIIHSFKNPNYSNKISYMLPETWLFFGVIYSSSKLLIYFLSLDSN